MATWFECRAMRPDFKIEETEDGGGRPWIGASWTEEPKKPGGKRLAFAVRVPNDEGARENLIKACHKEIRELEARKR